MSAGHNLHRLLRVFIGLLSRMMGNSQTFFKNFFHAIGDFWCLLITFANSLDPDQDRQNVGPDLDPNRLTLR